MKRTVINIIYSIVCFALSVAALVVMLKCTGLQIVPKSFSDWAYLSGHPTDYSCIQVAFGATLQARLVVFYASPLLCLEPFLLFFSAFLILFTALDSLVKRKIRVVFGVIATLFFIGAGVLFFLNGQLFVLGTYFHQKKVLEKVLLGRITFKIGSGAIAAGILSFVAATLTAVKTVLTIFKAL